LEADLHDQLQIAQILAALGRLGGEAFDRLSR
jgi:hypothetical protein